MQATAKFAGEFDASVTHLHNADLVAILFAEQSHSTASLGFIDVHHVGVDRQAFHDLGVHDVFDLLDFFSGHGVEVAEVEAEEFVRNEATLLLHVSAEHFAESGLEQVRCGVVLADVSATIVIDGCHEHGAHRLFVSFALHDLTTAESGIVHLHGVKHLDFEVGRNERSLVTNLATHFGVERRGFENDAQNALVFAPADNLRFASGEFITDKVCASFAVLRPAFGTHRVDALLHVGAGAGLLFFHALVVAIFVNRKALFFGEDAGEVRRESVGIVKQEHLVARHGLCVAEFSHDAGKAFEAGVQRADKAFFFALDDACDEVLAFADFREGVAHRIGEHLHQLVDKGFLLTEQAGKAAGAAQNAAEHVATAFVARQGAIGNSEGDCADVVGNHAVRGAGFAIVVRNAREFSNLCDNRSEHVSIVVAGLALENSADTFETHTGINVLGLERNEGAVAHAFVLHEHVIPNFNVAVVFAIHALDRVLERFGLRSEVATVIMDFGARTARTGVAHFPEVGVCIKTHDAVIRKTGHVLPNLPGFVIILIDSCEEAFLRELPNFSEEFPSPGNSFLLIIVTEAPVTEHFEEGVVVVVAAHDVEVVVLTRHAEALLAVACALPTLRIVAKEDGLELVHARVREHERRVVMRNHRRRTHKEVALGFEELDKGFAHLRRSHFFGHSYSFDFLRRQI